MKPIYRTSLIALLLAGCAGTDPDAGENVTGVQEPFLAYFELGPIHVKFPGATTHSDITEDGLDFLDDDVAEEIGEYNEDTDTGDTKSDSRYHVDNCQLVASFASIRERYDETVSYIGQGKYDEAIQVFGTILHTVQDFYAHSNWVDDAQPTGLTFNHPFEFPSVRAGNPLGTPFGSMVVLATGVPNSSVSLPAHKRVPRVTTDWGVVAGLITGTYDNGDGTSCLPSASIPHGDVLSVDGDDDPGSYLTKDVPGLLNREEALDRAVAQTTEEFCRLGRLVMLRRGKIVHDAMVSEWVDEPDDYRTSCGEMNRQVESLATAYLW
jgi:hypothetical protein